MDYLELTSEEESIGKAIVNAAFRVYKELGPGLLERVYEVCLCHELIKAGFNVKRQVEIPIVYDGISFDEGFRLDLLINNRVIVELKATETMNPLWKAQLISHLKLTELRLGYLINFNVSYFKQGINRIVV
jgi:GxxExxY protein